MLLEQAPVEYEKHVKSWVGQVPLAVQLIKFISDKHNSLYLLTKGRHSMQKDSYQNSTHMNRGEREGAHHGHVS